MSLKRTIYLAVLTAIILVGCNNKSKDAAELSIYHNGNIITMEGSAPRKVEAVVVKEGKITFVGDFAEAKKQFSKASTIDLRGNTLLPGFIDPHSHFGFVSNSMGQIDLNPPPVGDVSSIEDIKQKLKNYKETNNIPDGEWIFAWGYDESQMTEKRHPDKKDIDEVLPENPVYLQHASGHMGVANSMALEKMNITAVTENPAGGNIDRYPNSKEPNGLVQETAMYVFMGNMLSILEAHQEDYFDKTQDEYAANGITTAQDGMTARNAIDFYQSQADAGKLKIDLVALAGSAELQDNLADTILKWKTYKNRFKVQGTKIIGDGSPQGKTAFFSESYLTEVPGCMHDCKGLPSLSQEMLDSLFILAYQNDNQLFIHSNGDASIDMILSAHKKACEVLNEPLDKDRRTIVVHSQFVREEQLETYKKYNIEPSFFTNHAYFWGDAHVENLGKERAFFLSPIATADAMGLKYTNHSDATVTPLSPMFSVWSAVNRLSRTNKVIGEAERATPYQALKAITANAAYELFEEDIKGTLTVGKIADFVILDGDPLTIDPLKIKDIKVVETIKEGVSIYKSK